MLSPLLQQAFFIGDGLTGDGTGAAQTFYVPTGATQLYLGTTDACGYYGSPGCFEDNYGNFNVNAVGISATAAVPELVSWAMMIFGLGMIGGIMRLHRKSNGGGTAKLRGATA